MQKDFQIIKTLYAGKCLDVKRDKHVHAEWLFSPILVADMIILENGLWQQEHRN